MKLGRNPDSMSDSCLDGVEYTRCTGFTILKIVKSARFANLDKTYNANRFAVDVLGDFAVQMFDVWVPCVSRRCDDFG